MHAYVDIDNIVLYRQHVRLSNGFIRPVKSDSQSNNIVL